MSLLRNLLINKKSESPDVNGKKYQYKILAGGSDEVYQVKKKSIIIGIGIGHPAGFSTEYNPGSIDGNRFLEDSILLEAYTYTGQARAWDTALLS